MAGYLFLIFPRRWSVNDMSWGVKDTRKQRWNIDFHWIWWCLGMHFSSSLIHFPLNVRLFYESLFLTTRDMNFTYFMRLFICIEDIFMKKHRHVYERGNNMTVIWPIHFGSQEVSRISRETQILQTRFTDAPSKTRGILCNRDKNCSMHHTTPCLVRHISATEKEKVRIGHPNEEYSDFL